MKRVLVAVPQSICSLIAAIAILILPVIAFASEYEFTWSNPTPQGNELRGLAFESTSIGYAVGKRGAVVRTLQRGLPLHLL